MYLSYLGTFLGKEIDKIAKAHEDEVKESKHEGAFAFGGQIKPQMDVYKQWRFFEDLQLPAAVQEVCFPDHYDFDWAWDYFRVRIYDDVCVCVLLNF